jgi:hypothetical protein
LQATIIIGIGFFLFQVPILGSLTLLAVLSTLFIGANLSIGYTFSTIAQNQLQAMQMSMMFFLPNILLSGFMFPFAGMPVWAQRIGRRCPHALHPHCPRDHAERRFAAKFAIRCHCALRSDADCDDDRGDPVQANIGLSAPVILYPSHELAVAAGRYGLAWKADGGFSSCRYVG